MNSPTATIVVSRTSPKDIGMRDLYVLIDDMEERTLLHGQAMNVEVPPGSHSVRVTNRLFNKDLQIEAGPGETVSLLASNRRLRGLLGAIFSVFVVIGGTGAYTVTLERIKPPTDAS